MMNDKDLAINKSLKKANNLFLIVYFILMISPRTGFFDYLRPAVCLLYFAHIHLHYRIPVIFNVQHFLFFLVWISCILFGQLVVVGQINQGAVIHEVLRVVMYFVIFLPLQDIYISKKMLLILTSIFLIFNCTIQILQLLKVEFAFDFIKSVYLETNDLRHLNLARADNWTAFRSGSIFVNPNVYTPLALLSTSVIFYELENSIEQKNVNKQPFLCLMLLIASVTLFLTGSRTAFIAMAVMILIFVIKVGGKRALIAIGLSTIFIVLFIILINNGSRFTNLEGGMDDSFGVKISELFAYFVEVNPVSFIVGNNSNIGSYEWGFDFEWGYVIVYTGFVGLCNYLIIHKTLLNKCKIKSQDSLYKYILIAMIIQTLSATMLYNASAYPLLALFVFSKGVLDE